jgi:hypothetical protein
MKTAPEDKNQLALKEDFLALSEDISALGNRMDQLFKNQLKSIIIVMLSILLVIIIMKGTKLL